MKRQCLTLFIAGSLTLVTACGEGQKHAKFNRNNKDSITQDQKQQKLQFSQFEGYSLLTQEEINSLINFQDSIGINQDDQIGEGKYLLKSFLVQLQLKSSNTEKESEWLVINYQNATSENRQTNEDKVDTVLQLKKLTDKPFSMKMSNLEASKTLSNSGETIDLEIPMEIQVQPMKASDVKKSAEETSKPEEAKEKVEVKAENSLPIDLNQLNKFKDAKLSINIKKTEGQDSDEKEISIESFEPKLDLLDSDSKLYSDFQKTTAYNWLKVSENKKIFVIFEKVTNSQFNMHVITEVEDGNEIQKSHVIYNFLRNIEGSRVRPEAAKKEVVLSSDNSGGTKTTEITNQSQRPTSIRKMRRR